MCSAVRYLLAAFLHGITFPAILLSRAVAIMLTKHIAKEKKSASGLLLYRIILNQPLSHKE